MTETIVAFGGNIGDVLAGFLSAREQLDRIKGLQILDSSCVYRSPPWDCPVHTKRSSESSPAGQPTGSVEQPDYLNAITLLNTNMTAETLLQHLQTIEKEHGRIRAEERWGPRTLDLDLIAYNDTVMQTKRLTLPHPHMHERMFVLQPLCDIRPNWRHPVLKQTARGLLKELAASGIPLLEEKQIW